MAESEEPQTQAMQDVDHARHARVLPKRHHPLALIVHHLLVIDQADVLLQRTNKDVNPDVTPVKM